MLGIFYSLEAPEKLMQQMRSGEIAIQLLRPLNYIVRLLSEDLGGIMFNIVIKIIPIGLISLLMFGSFAGAVHDVKDPETYDRKPGELVLTGLVPGERRNVTRLAIRPFWRTVLEISP